MPKPIDWDAEIEFENAPDVPVSVALGYCVPYEFHDEKCVVLRYGSNLRLTTLDGKTSKNWFDTEGYGAVVNKGPLVIEDWRL